MKNHQSKSWLAAASGLSGSAQLATGNGKRLFSHAPSGELVVPSVVKHIKSQPTFAEAQPAELAEWDYERNDAHGFYPDNTTLGSKKLVHWICSLCPTGQPHRWTATPSNRIGEGSGCAVCAGLQACVCNSLESLAPSAVAEFHVDKNGFAPFEISAQYGKKVWWRNATRGSWRRSVQHRTEPLRARPRPRHASKKPSA